MSPAEKQAREEMADRKMNTATEAAYTKSLRNTEYAPEKKDPRDAVRGQRGYASGGSVKPMPTPPPRPEPQPQPKAPVAPVVKAPVAPPTVTPPTVTPIRRSPVTGRPGKTSSVMTMSKGGMTASKRADGIAKRGKTKGTMVKMNYGGKC